MRDHDARSRKAVIRSKIGPLRRRAGMPVRAAGNPLDPRKYHIFNRLQVAQNPLRYRCCTAQPGGCENELTILLAIMRVIASKNGPHETGPVCRIFDATI